MDKLQQFGAVKPTENLTLPVFWILLAAGFFGFWLGRHFSPAANDFVVYHRAAQSLLAGRTDLYSDTFALGPPMIYVYPPLFLLLVFPIGWLSFVNASGVWFALMAIAAAAVVRQAVRQWQPENRVRYGLLLLVLTGPFLTLCFRSGNVHLFVVLLTILAFLAWSRGRQWLVSVALATGGAFKIFPLLLMPVFIVRREWGLVARTTALTCVLWLLPVLYFGPQPTMGLYRSWYDTVIRDIGAYKRQRAVDLSLDGALERWLTRIDYSRYADPEYPQATVIELRLPVAKAVTVFIKAVVSGLSLWTCARLAGSRLERQRSLAAVASIFMTAQLLLGPYTPIQQLSGWLLTGLALPVALNRDFLVRVLFGIGIVNALLFAIPGRMSQRALQAYGVFTVIGLSLWLLAIAAGWTLARSSNGASMNTIREGDDGFPEVAAHQA